MVVTTGYVGGYDGMRRVVCNALKYSQWSSMLTLIMLLYLRQNELQDLDRLKPETSDRPDAAGPDIYSTQSTDTKSERPIAPKPAPRPSLRKKNPNSTTVCIWTRPDTQSVVQSLVQSSSAYGPKSSSDLLNSLRLFLSVSSTHTYLYQL